MWSMKLRVSRSLYEERRDRMAAFIRVKAPDCVINMAARLLVECFEYTLLDRIERWIFNSGPEWLCWISSKEYREACREVPLEEDEYDQAI